MSVYGGIDVSKDSLDVGLLDGAQREHATFANDTDGVVKVLRFLKKRRRKAVAVCLEATGHYGEGVADFRYQAGYRVRVVNPARLKGDAESQLTRNKTDKLDAYLMADFCRPQQPEPWSPPPPESRDLNALVRHLEALAKSRGQVANHLNAAPPRSTVANHLPAQLSLLAEPRHQTKQAIADPIDQHPDRRRQRDWRASIPGLGDLTAGKLLAERRAIAAFDTVGQLVAFAGLNPRQHPSGTAVHNASPISKGGRASRRAALYRPAIVANPHTPILAVFAARLQARGVTGLQLIGAVMRLLLPPCYGILKSGRPFDPYCLTQPA